MLFLTYNFKNGVFQSKQVRGLLLLNLPVLCLLPCFKFTLPNFDGANAALTELLVTVGKAQCSTCSCVCTKKRINLCLWVFIDFNRLFSSSAYYNS